MNSPTPVLAFSSSKSNIATPVVSLPVPAVVGTENTHIINNFTGVQGRDCLKQHTLFPILLLGSCAVKLRLLFVSLNVILNPAFCTTESHIVSYLLTFLFIFLAWIESTASVQQILGCACCIVFSSMFQCCWNVS